MSERHAFMKFTSYKNDVPQSNVIKRHHEVKIHGLTLLKLHHKYVAKTGTFSCDENWCTSLEKRCTSLLYFSKMYRLDQ